MIDEFLLDNGLDLKGIEKLRAELRCNSFKKGDHFISYGQVSRHIALVEKGYLRTYHSDENGDEVTTEFSKPDTFCGSYYSFYSRRPSFEFVEAITDCELLLLSFDSLQKLYANNLGMNVFGRTVLEKACIERDLRINNILHLGAMEKYKWFLENYADIYKIAKLGHIASFLGIKQETLSRVRRKIIF